MLVFWLYLFSILCAAFEIYFITAVVNFYERAEELTPTVEKTRSNVVRKRAYACNFAGETEIADVKSLSHWHQNWKIRHAAIFLRIVFKRCICTPTALFITPAENCSHRANCYNLQRRTADNNRYERCQGIKKDVSFDLHIVRIKVVTLLWWCNMIATL